ncbi:unnamed protein product [Ascophyllum nodosum]
MDRGFDAGVAVVPDTNGSVNENVDMDVNARVRRETSPAVVPIGRGEPPVAGVRTGEGMILPSQSERWRSRIFRAIPSTQRVRSFVRTPEMVIFLLGLASLISLIIFVYDVITSKTFRPLTVAVFFSAGGYCILFIQGECVLAEIMEARAADTSRRVITKEERRLLLHYFTLGPPTPLENTSSCEDAPSGACTPSGTSTAPGHGDGREAGGFSRKDLVQSSSDDEEAGKAQGGDPMNAAVPPRDGPLGGGEGSVPTRGETRAVESETRRGGRRSGSALQKVFSRPRPHGIDVMESTEAGARGQQHPDTAAVGEIVDAQGAPREDKDICADACSTDDAMPGCSRDGHACSAPEKKEKDEKEEEEAQRRASWKWGTGEQCVVCFGEYFYGEDLCQLPCCHMYHATVTILRHKMPLAVVLCI